MPASAAVSRIGGTAEIWVAYVVTRSAIVGMCFCPLCLALVVADAGSAAAARARAAMKAIVLLMFLTLPAREGGRRIAPAPSPARDVPVGLAERGRSPRRGSAQTGGARALA